MKMLKTLLLTAFFGLSAAFVSADMRNTPRGPGQALASADYSGYEVSTGIFTVDTITATLSGSGILRDVVFSTGNAAANDFVDVWDATSTVTANDSVLLGRFYNSASAYSVNSSTGSGSKGPKYPLHYGSGLLWKANVGTYNLITVLYYKE